MRNYVINNKEFRKKHSPLVKLSLTDKKNHMKKKVLVFIVKSIIFLLFFFSFTYIKKEYGDGPAIRLWERIDRVFYINHS